MENENVGAETSDPNPRLHARKHRSLQDLDRAVAKRSTIAGVRKNIN